MSPFLTPGPPKTQRAVKVQGPGSAAVIPDSPVPTIRENELLIRVICIALNPVDWKSLDLSPAAGATWGIDFSGEVVSTGSTVEQFTIGDSVCGAAFGNNPDDHDQGAFAEYMVMPADLTFKMPKSMSFEQAATIGTGLATAGLALYQTLKLPWPNAPSTEPQYVLVHGGGTASGTMLIQLIRLSGLIPITTCSPTSSPRCLSLGAEKTFDYNDVNTGTLIREYTSNTLTHVVDCISTADSMKLCYNAISSTKGGQYVSLDPFPIRSHTRRAVKPSWIIGFTIYGAPVNWKRPYKRDARPQDRKFGREFWRVCQMLLDGGKIECHPRRMEEGGLEGVIRGGAMGRNGEVGGVKLVYRVGSG